MHATEETKESFERETDVHEFDIDAKGVYVTSRPLSVKLEVVDDVEPRLKNLGGTVSSSMQGEIRQIKSPVMEEERAVHIDLGEESEPMLGSGTSAPSGSVGDSDGETEERRKLITLEQGKLPSSQFKGVVPQPNGRWGAQIYDKHQRVWLGTFNREEDAAKAYDIAAMKFRGREAMTNFRPPQDGDPEATFLNVHTKEQIIDMLRRHIYSEKLEQSQKVICMESARPPMMTTENGLCSTPGQESTRVTEKTETEQKPQDFGGSANAYVNGAKSLQREHLFDKAVTPSDVGKLNRLVIPKQHAERYFPLDVSTNEKGVLLSFEDSTGKMWRFRYSYWNSSQSYVLTKGWSRFVKEKTLDAGDIVTFERDSKRQLFISCRRRPSGDQQSILNMTSLLKPTSHINELQNWGYGYGSDAVSCSEWLRVLPSGRNSLHRMQPSKLQSNESSLAVDSYVHNHGTPQTSHSAAWREQRLHSRSCQSAIDSKSFNRTYNAGAPTQTSFLCPSGRQDHGASSADKEALGFYTSLGAPSAAHPPSIQRNGISINMDSSGRAGSFSQSNSIPKFNENSWKTSHCGVELSSEVGNIDTALTLGRYKSKETESLISNRTLPTKCETARKRLRLFGVDLRPSLWSATQ